MVDVRTQRCGTEGCSKQPSFGAADGRKAEFCAVHASAGMVHVSRKRRGKEDCSKHLSSGAAGERTASFCATHEPVSNVNYLISRFDKEGCSQLTSFGGVQAPMKTEIEMTVAPPRGFDGIRTGGEPVPAQPSSCDSVSNGGSSGISTHRSCDRSIARGRSTKRLRRTVQNESAFNVVAEDDDMFEQEGGDDVKLELAVSASSGRVSAASSRPRGM